MPLTETNIDQFYQIIETEKTSSLNKMKEVNIDKKDLRKMNQLFSVLTQLQSNLLRLRSLTKQENN